MVSKCWWKIQFSDKVYCIVLANILTRKRFRSTNAMVLFPPAPAFSFWHHTPTALTSDQSPPEKSQIWHKSFLKLLRQSRTRCSDDSGTSRNREILGSESWLLAKVQYSRFTFGMLQALHKMYEVIIQYRLRKDKGEKSANSLQRKKSVEF